jgi:hypothetical protein
MEDVDAQLVLQAPDLLRYRGLRQEELLAGLRQRAVAGDGFDGA